MSRVTSFGRPLPSQPWRRAWRSRGGQTGFEAFPARAAAFTALAALVLGNALIVYQLTTHETDPSSGELRQIRNENLGGSLSEIDEVLQDIRASIDARIEKLEPIRIERSTHQERHRDTADQARRTRKTSVSSDPADSGSAPSGASPTTSASTSDSTGSTPDGATSGGASSSNSGGGSQNETTGSSTGGGSGADVGSDSGTGSSGAGGGGGTGSGSGTTGGGTSGGSSGGGSGGG